MANTINKEKVLSARILVLLQEPTAWEVMANTDYKGELAEAGDTVRVQNFPIVEWDSETGEVQNLGGEKITVKDWALQFSDLKVDRVSTINLKVKDIEKQLSNLDLNSGLLAAINNGKKRKVSRLIRDTAIAWAGQIIGDTAPEAITSTNVNEVIAKVMAKLDDNDVPAEGRFIFVKPELAAIIINAKGFDGTEVGAKMRKLGVIGDYMGFTVVKDSTLESGVAVACDKNSVHYVSLLNKVKVVWEEVNNEGFYSNILWELIDGAKVLEGNKNRICKLSYQLG